MTAKLITIYRYTTTTIYKDSTYFSKDSDAFTMAMPMRPPSSMVSPQSGEGYPPDYGHWYNVEWRHTGVVLPGINGLFALQWAAEVESHDKPEEQREKTSKTTRVSRD